MYQRVHSRALGKTSQAITLIPQLMVHSQKISLCWGLKGLQLLHKHHKSSTLGSTPVSRLAPKFNVAVPGVQILFGIEQSRDVEEIASLCT